VQPVMSCSSIGQPAPPLVLVFVLNWSEWSDAAECLESLCRLDCPECRIIVVDNGSNDGSVEHISPWADGRESPEVGVPEFLRELAEPLVAKPLTW
jgi:hypothetical protein